MLHLPARPSVDRRFAMDHVTMVHHVASLLLVSGIEYSLPFRYHSGNDKKCFRRLCLHPDPKFDDVVGSSGRALEMQKASGSGNGNKTSTRAPAVHGIMRVAPESFWEGPLTSWPWETSNATLNTIEHCHQAAQPNMIVVLGRRFCGVYVCKHC